MERIKKGDGLKIRISGLPSGLHEYHFSAIPAELGLDSGFISPIGVDVAVDKTSRQVYLTANIRTDANFTCDRCLDNFDRPLNAKFVMLYVFDEIDRGRLSDDEVQVITPDTVAINIADDVRQMIVLSVPLKLLCKDECQGLCPHCGKNKNLEQCDCRNDEADSRWQALEGLKALKELKGLKGLPNN